MAMAEARKELGVDKKKEEEKWVTHYSSKHHILLVGEGDFSFSLCLASSFGSASNICATSLDSEDHVINNYKNAKSNLEILKKLGVSILHGVDATKMKNLDALKRHKFDRIIFNFPHSGFHGNEDYYWVIQNHKTLVRGFFSNASRMLQVKGEIHVNHKITPPYCYWNLEELASENSLELIVMVEFKIGDYPGYTNKRGAGPKCDEPFPLHLCNTYKFRFLDRAKNMSWQFQDSPAQMQLLQRNISGFNYNHRKHMNPFPLLPQLPSTVDAMNDCSWIFNTCSNAEFGRDINSPREAELLCILSNFSLLPRNHIRCHGGLPSTINAGLVSHINYPIQAGLQCRYQTTNVNHFQPCLELTCTICTGREIEYQRQVGLQRTFPDFSWPQRYHITGVNHIQPHVGLPSAINAGLGSHINYPIQAGLQCRYQTTNVNHFQPSLELTSTICAGRDIEYRSQAGLQHTFPDFSWPQRYHITDLNHIQPHVGLPSTIKAGNDHSWVFGGNFNGQVETYPRPSYNVQCSTVERPRYNSDVAYSLPAGVKHDFGRRTVEVRKRTSREGVLRL